MTAPAFQYILLVEMEGTTPIAYGPYLALGQAQIDLANQTSAAAVVPLYPAIS
jgi:hypothetical protein